MIASQRLTTGSTGQDKQILSIICPNFISGELKFIIDFRGAHIYCLFQGSSHLSFISGELTIINYQLSFQRSSLLPSVFLNNRPRLLPPCQRVEKEGELVLVLRTQKVETEGESDHLDFDDNLKGGKGSS